jgi:hypothetical protein
MLNYLRQGLLLTVVASTALVATSEAPATSDQAALAVPRIVLGIIAYSRWPQKPDPFRLCVAGDAAEIDALFDVRSVVGGNAVAPVQLDIHTPRLEGLCDIFYVGRGLDSASRRALYMGAEGQAMLTISTADPDCREGSLFCLKWSSDVATPALLLNLEAITRSPIQVNPRVLQITRGSEERR